MERGNKRRKEIILVLWGGCIHRRCLSPTARRCYCELKESVRQLSLVCVRLPFSELWRRRVKKNQRSTMHITGGS